MASSCWTRAPWNDGPAGFFFQAADGIRGHCVTGVQTCALPIFGGGAAEDGESGDVVAADEGAEAVGGDGGGDADDAVPGDHDFTDVDACEAEGALDEVLLGEIGRASCRERVWRSVGGGGFGTHG